MRINIGVNNIKNVNTCLNQNIQIPPTSIKILVIFKNTFYRQNFPACGYSEKNSCWVCIRIIVVGVYVRIVFFVIVNYKIS